MPPSSKPPRQSLGRDLRETLGSLVVAFLIFLVVRTAIFQPFTIPSSSMEPGLVTGDYIIASKLAYGWSRASFPLDPPLFKGRILGRLAQRGDVVVFRLPRDPRQTWVKRIIGLPGDRIQVRSGTVFVNGRAIPQTPVGVRADHDDRSRAVELVRETLPNGRSWLTYHGPPGAEGEDTGVYVVPQGDYFVMGDNRDNSLDSRWPGSVGVGMLPAENLEGKAEIVVLSWKPGAGLLKPWTWLNFQRGRVLRPIH